MFADNCGWIALPDQTKKLWGNRNNARSEVAVPPRFLLDQAVQCSWQFSAGIRD
jgi:hypothetical protein